MVWSKIALHFCQFVMKIWKAVSQNMHNNFRETNFNPLSSLFIQCQSFCIFISLILSVCHLWKSKSCFLPFSMQVLKKQIMFWHTIILLFFIFECPIILNFYILTTNYSLFFGPFSVIFAIIGTCLLCSSPKFTNTRVFTLNLFIVLLKQ